MKTKWYINDFYKQFEELNEKLDKLIDIYIKKRKKEQFINLWPKNDKNSV